MKATKSCDYMSLMHRARWTANTDRHVQLAKHQKTLAVTNPSSPLNFCYFGDYTYLRGMSPFIKDRLYIVKHKKLSLVTVTPFIWGSILNTWCNISCLLMLLFTGHSCLA